MKEADKDSEYDKYQYKRCSKCGEVKGRSEDYRFSSDGKGSPICFDCEDPSVEEAAKKARLEFYAAPSSKFTHWEKWFWAYMIFGVIAVLFVSHGLDVSEWWEDITGPTAVMFGGGGMLASGGILLALVVPEENRNEHGSLQILCAIGFLVSLFVFMIGYWNYY